MISNKNKKRQKINLKENLTEYFRFLKKYRLRFILLLLIILGVESSIVMDKFLFKVLIDRGSEYSSGIIGRTEFMDVIYVLLVVFLSVLAFRIIGKWLNQHMINILEVNLMLDLKERYFNHILSLSYSFHTTHKTGSLISKLTRGRGAIEGLTDIIVFNFTPLVFQLLIVAGSIVSLDYMSAVIVAATVIAFVTYSIIVQNMLQGSNLEENECEDNEKANISDIFSNIESIKYFGKEEKIKTKFLDLANLTRSATLRHWGYYRWLDSGQALILGIGTVMIIYFPMQKFMEGGMTIGSLAFIYTVYVSLVSSMFGFVYGIRNFYRVLADLDALFKYAKIEKEIKDRPNAKNIRIERGEIEFKNVNFSYGKRKVFDDFNLKIRPGENVAIVGHSGSGKTSLIKLLYRFYDIDSGSIRIDGEDIRDVRQESLRKEMSIVPQECALFDDSIYNNIMFSNERARKEEVIRAIRFAQLDRTIEMLPAKEDTVVGERGVKLSGGEKQRVSIARAILADKKILVLDEATSSLDSRTEHEIQEDLRKLMRGRTSIIIAHRLSTIMSADRIIVMDKGKIVQTGKHNKLIIEEGEYKKLWNLQKGGYIR